MRFFRRFLLLAATGVLVALVGCRAPLTVNRSLVVRHHALQDKSLLGVWRLNHGTGRPSQMIVFIYPLGKKRFLITCCHFKPAAAPGDRLKGELTGAFISSLTKLDGRWWMSCRSMYPRLIYSADMEAWWQKHAAAGQPTKYAAALKKTGMASARATGMARIFFLVEVHKISRNRLAVYPLLVPQNGHHAPFIVPAAILQSRRKLIAFLSAHTLAHLLPKQPMILQRMSVAQAEPYMPVQ